VTYHGYQTRNDLAADGIRDLRRTCETANGGTRRVQGRARADSNVTGWAAFRRATYDRHDYALEKPRPHRAVRSRYLDKLALAEKANVLAMPQRKRERETVDNTLDMLETPTQQHEAGATNYRRA
jgi:hypothetical protein